MTDSDGDRIMNASAVAISASSVLAALIQHLKRISILSVEDEIEIYDMALFLMESVRTESPEAAKVFELAREIIEAQLRAD